jgi:tRNA modification GTPase
MWVVRNKIDLNPAAAGSGQGSEDIRLEISASRGDGIQHLVARLVAFAQDYFGSSETGMIGRERQRKLLQQTATALQRSISAVGEGEELAAEDLRTAVHSLGKLLGRVDVEDILDVIFRDFCIGK